MKKQTKKTAEINKAKKAINSPMVGIEKMLKEMQEMQNKINLISQGIKQSADKLSSADKIKIVEEEDKRIAELSSALAIAKADRKRKLISFGIEIATSQTGNGRSNIFAFDCNIKKNNLTFTIKKQGEQKAFSADMSITKSGNKNIVSFENRKKYLDDCCLFYGIQGKDINNNKYLFTQKLLEYTAPNNIDLINSAGVELKQ